jgi:multidrug efflux pump subunit AcrA (membrane-fusion protein)
MPPGVKCWVWRVALFKLVIGLVWVGSVKLAVLPAKTTAVADARESLSSVGEEEAAPAGVTAVHPKVGRPLDWSVVFVSVWGLGVAAMGVMYVVRYFRTRRVRAVCTAVNDGGLIRAYEAVGRRMGLPKVPALLECGGISGPVVLGVIRPVAVVPVGLGRGLAASDAMLAHELAHVIRSDTRWALLTMVARTLFWFHPLAWLAERELGMCQESACDMRAMVVVGVRAPEYGRMLLDVVAGLQPGRQRVMGVGVVSTYSSLHRRISAMRHFKVWSVRRRVMAGCVIGAVGVCAIVPWKLTAQEVKNDQEVKKEAGSAKDERPATRQAHDKAFSDWLAKGEGEKLTLPGVVMTRLVVVRASADGTVEKVAAMLGDSVKKGQVLASFNNAVAGVGLMQAKAALEKDQVAVMRGQVEKRSAEAEVARANVEYDKAQLILKEHELEALSVKSPIDGVVSEMKVHEGEFVSKGAELMSVVMVKNPRVEVWVPVQDFSKMKGQEVEFRTKAVEKVFRGKIVFVSPVVDGQSGTVRVEAEVDDSEGVLRPGLAGEVTVLGK